MDAPPRPQLPHGHHVEVVGRGRMFYREVAGPPGAPVLVLLHGWTITADLNFHMLYEPLGRWFRVIAPDHRGHGQGIRAMERFTLEDCADDVAELCRQLGVERAIAVGYSMGGIVAQLLWKRHRSLVEGLILCATAGRFTESRRDQAMFGALGGLSYAARMLPDGWRRRLGMGLATRSSELEPWVREELETHDWARVGEAGLAIGAHDSTAWLRAINVPASVIATLHDDVVLPMRQLRMARSIPGADLHLIEGTHAVCSEDPERFGDVLVTAIREVARRSAVREASKSPTARRVRQPEPAPTRDPHRRWTDHRSLGMAAGGVGMTGPPAPTRVDEDLHEPRPGFTVWRSSEPSQPADAAEPVEPAEPAAS